MPSLVRIFGKTPAYDLVDRRRHQRLKRGDRGRLTLEDRKADSGRAVPVECPLPGQHLVEDRTEREQIAAGVHLAAANLFGRHVANRTRDGATARQVRIVTLAGLEQPVPGRVHGGAAERLVRLCRTDSCGRQEFREAKIEELRAARGQHDVGGLQIAMDDSVAMRVVERAGDLVRVGQRQVQRQRPVRQSRGQRVTLEVLHDEEVDLVMTPDIVERADVRVGQRSDRFCFAGEPGAHLLIERDAARKNFDCHRTIETGVGAAEDFSHASGAERAFNAVRAQRRTRTKVGTIVEQQCRGGPHRPIHDDLRRLLTEQRLHFAPQRLVARAGFGEELCPAWTDPVRRPTRRFWRSAASARESSSSFSPFGGA